MKTCRSCLRPLKPGFGCKHCAKKAGTTVIHRAVAAADNGRLSDEKLAQLTRIIAKRAAKIKRSLFKSGWATHEKVGKFGERMV